MKAQDLRKDLEDANDKFNIFEDRYLFSKYSLKVSELIDFVNEFLSDEQKAKLLEFEHFKQLSSHIKTKIIENIQDDNIKLKILENDKVISEFQNYEIMKLINSLEDDGKIQILHKGDLKQKYNISLYDIQKIIKSLSDEKKQAVLFDSDFIKQELQLDEYDISQLVAGLNLEETKLKMIDIYKLKNYNIINILETFSDEGKISSILENKYKFDGINLKQIISKLSDEGIVDFIKENKQFLEQNDIKAYEITKCLDKQSQLNIISKLEEMELDINEKKKIILTLRKETKNEIDVSKLLPEYVDVIELQINDQISDWGTYGKIIIDFNKNLEIYRGLDEIISINPMKISTEDKQKLMQLCEICPQIQINDNIGLASSTAEEYVKSEIWIDSILQEIDKEWSDIQKVAYIDNVIGKKISYTPDFDTEICDESNARALWKIIHSGYGVCNGIAQVEQYILSKVGIEAEIISGKKHAFLKLKDIELPNDKGDMVTGATILDPTWNLTAHRFGCKPENFCRSYTEIRKNDIRDNGTDAECHRNDEKLESATLDLDEKNLRKIFTSIGVADKDGNFPIKELIDKSKIIDDCKLPEEESIKQQLLLLSKYNTGLTKCQNSTMSILQRVTLNQENLKFNKCVVNRVYEKKDENKIPVVYIYVDLPEVGKKFYYADRETEQFIELPQKEFEEKFECYEMDMENQNGHRPWEDITTIEKVEDLTRSSGKVIASEGDER